VGTVVAMDTDGLIRPVDQLEAPINVLGRVVRIGAGFVDVTDEPDFIPEGHGPRNPPLETCLICDGTGGVPNFTPGGVSMTCPDCNGRGAV
jgi:hypothetical protein